MIEKILEKIQELIDESFSNSLKGYTFASARNGAYQKVKKIVQEVAKDGGWIPCEIELPKEATTYEVTCEIILCSEKQYITTYALWGTEGEWICRKNERVIAWKEKSAPYQKGE